MKCPDCGSSKTSKLYCTTETIIYCQNGAHKGFHAYKTAARDSKDFGKTFEKVSWNYKCPDELIEDSD